MINCLDFEINVHTLALSHLKKKTEIETSMYAQDNYLCAQKLFL